MDPIMPSTNTTTLWKVFIWMSSRHLRSSRPFVRIQAARAFPSRSLWKVLCRVSVSRNPPCECAWTKLKRASWSWWTVWSAYTEMPNEIFALAASVQIREERSRVMVLKVYIDSDSEYFFEITVPSLLFYVYISYIDYVHPLKGTVPLLKHLLCERVLFPSREANHNPQEFQRRKKVFQRDCCFNDCARCDAFAQSNACILQCPQIFNADTRYKWRAFDVVVLDNGRELRELKDFEGTLEEFQEVFMITFLKFKKHYFVYRWLNLCREEDIAHLGPNVIFILTDYSSQPILGHQDKLNSMGHGVCILACWVVVHSPTVKHYMHEGERKEYVHYECDHIRIITPSTGKQKDQDW